MATRLPPRSIRLDLMSSFLPSKFLEFTDMPFVWRLLICSCFVLYKCFFFNVGCSIERDNGKIRSTFELVGFHHNGFLNVTQNFKRLNYMILETARGRLWV